MLKLLYIYIYILCILRIKLETIRKIIRLELMKHTLVYLCTFAISQVARLMHGQVCDRIWNFNISRFRWNLFRALRCHVDEFGIVTRVPRSFSAWLFV